MGRNAIETVLGAVVLVIAGLFLVFAYSSADLQKVKGYTVNAYFPMVDGVKDGTDVKINGVKVGSVAAMSLVTEPGPNQYKVHVRMTILDSVVLPVDTIAMVASESLLGGKYMSLEVGVDEETVKTDGTGRLTRTQSPMRLDDLIGQLIYSSKKSDSSDGTAKPSPEPTASAAVPAPAAQPAVAPAPVHAAPLKEPNTPKPPKAPEAPKTPAIVPPPPVPAPAPLAPSPVGPAHP